MATTPDAHGYWIVDSAGDVYSFGDPGFYGSLPGELGASSRPSANDVVTGHQATIPVTGFAATADGHGYWMATTNGTIYTFGDAAQDGSCPHSGWLRRPSQSRVTHSRQRSGSVSHSLRCRLWCGHLMEVDIGSRLS